MTLIYCRKPVYYRGRPLIIRFGKGGRVVYGAAAGFFKDIFFAKQRILAIFSRIFFQFSSTFKMGLVAILTQLHFLYILFFLEPLFTNLFPGPLFFAKKARPTYWMINDAPLTIDKLHRKYLHECFNHC